MCFPVAVLMWFVQWAKMCYFETKDCFVLSYIHAAGLLEPADIAFMCLNT